MVIIATGAIVRDDGPGWGNLFFLIGFWNTIRFIWLIPVAVVRLLRVRRQEKMLLRDWQRMRPADPTPAETGRMNAPMPAAQASRAPSNGHRATCLPSPTSASHPRLLMRWPRQVERQQAQIALAADRLRLRMAEKFVDIGYSGMNLDRPNLRCLLDRVTAVQVGCCVVATRDRLSEDLEHTADIDEVLDHALVAIVVAADHIWPE